MPLIDQQKERQQDDLQLKLQSINGKYLKMIINQTILSIFCTLTTLTVLTTC